MTTSDGVTLQHPAMSITDLYPRLDTDTISILSSQSDSVQHLSYNESDDDGKDLVDYNSSHPYDTINQTYQPSALKKDWITYLTKSSNGNNDKHYRSSSDDRSSPLTSPSSSSALSPVPDNDANSTEDPWIINKVQRDYYTKQFQSLQTDHTKFINGKFSFLFSIIRFEKFYYCFREATLRRNFSNVQIYQRANCLTYGICLMLIMMVPYH